MSTSKRRKKIREEENLLFSNPNTPNTLDPKTADAIGFGLGELALDIAAADSEFQAIEAISIQNIVPNILQPRYAVPHTLTNRFQVEAKNMVDIFKHWIEEIQIEMSLSGRHDEFDLEAHLLGKDTDRSKDAYEVEDKAIPAITNNSGASFEKSFMKIVDLAASIRRDGLSNPVSLVRHDNLYEIETGERRWIAYHLLYWQFGEDDLLPSQQKRNWSRIPARVVREIDVWRQASENNARDNLNAISRARQLALLLMDLHGWDKFIPFNEFENEQDFYAQVADGEQWRIPRGQGERLLNAMGFSNASQLRQYRRLLRLSSDDWQQGDDEDISEGELRKRLKSHQNLANRSLSTNESDPVKKLAKDASNWRTKLRQEMSTTDQKTRVELRNLITEEITELQNMIDELDNV